MSAKPSISKYLIEKCRTNNIPFAVILELTYRCNLICKHCYTRKEKRAELTIEKIKDILDQLVECGTFYINYTGGEIFLRSDFFDILSYAKKKGFFQVLLTNGTFINSESINFLKEIKPQGVEISLLGATPQTHDSITGVQGSFRKALEAIRLLRKNNIFVYSKTTLMKSNVHEYKKIKSLAVGMGAYPRISAGILPRFDGSTEPQTYAINLEDRKRFLNNDILDESFNTLIEDGDATSSLTCKAGRCLACINPYGDVSPCVVLPVKLGNIHDAPFKEIWHNKEHDTLNELRNLNESDLEKCMTCREKDICVRCTGAAYLEHKSLCTPSSLACIDAQWKSYLLTQKE